MSDKDMINELKRIIPIDLLTTQQREEAKKFDTSLQAVKYINHIIKDGLKVAKIYYDLYMKDYGEF